MKDVKLLNEFSVNISKVYLGVHRNRKKYDMRHIVKMGSGTQLYNYCTIVSNIRA